MEEWEMAAAKREITIESRFLSASGLSPGGETLLLTGTAKMRLLSQGEDSERGSFMSLTVACQRGNIRPPCTSEGCSMHVDQLMMLDSQASSSMTLAGEKQRRSCSSRQQKQGGKKNEK